MEQSGNFWPTLCLQKVMLPLFLLIACCLRQNGFSLVYLVLLLCNPFVPVANPDNVNKGGPGHYLILNMVFPSVNLAAQIFFQILPLMKVDYRESLKPFCSFFEALLRHIGLVTLNEMKLVPIVYLLAPDVLVVFAGVLIYLFCRCLNRKSALEENLLPIVAAPIIVHTVAPPTLQDVEARRKRYSVAIALGKCVCLFSLCLAGIIQPSALGLVYFVLFLGCMTFWACSRNMTRGFLFVCFFVPFVIYFHIIAIFMYQTQWAQDFIPSDSGIARFTGLVPLFVTDCSEDPRVTKMSDARWTAFVNPIVLVWLLFILSYQTSALMNPPADKKKTEEDGGGGGGVGGGGGLSRQLSVRLSQRRLLRNQANRWRTATRKVRLIRGKDSSAKRIGKTRMLMQDPHGSVTMSDDTDDAAKLENVPEEEEDEGDKGQGVLEMFFNAVLVISQLIAQSSYIATNIIMMAWSITYHSWLTFVLLLWASVMWMLPNQRRAMLRTSPFLVFYAMFLLIVQYIYGMDVTDSEVPQQIKGFNLKQIGFEKERSYPVRPLFVKTMFTMMFWMTLRQYNQEKWEARNAAALAEMATPLQEGADAGAAEKEGQTKTNQLMKSVGQVLRQFLVKYWIWVVAIFLFWIGISGERMTIFQIVYMALALFFILTFQLSWTLWRKIMYGFWLTVIIYSMLILVLTYTYQFDNFVMYWEKYLHIDQKLQRDIGLQRFETTELFIRLLTPTFFVIITVIQLYYFHKDFLAISDIKSRGTSSVRPSRRNTAKNTSKWKRQQSDTSGNSANLEETASHHSERSVDTDDDDDALSLPQQPEKEETVGTRFKHLMQELWHYISFVIELIWTYLELHMLKLIMFAIVLLAICNVCALHFTLVMMAVISLTFGTHIQTLCAHICSVLVSLYLLAKMVYQIEYIDHSFWNVTCNKTTEMDTNSTVVYYNSAKWLGFEKTSGDVTLFQLIRGYIAIIFVVTVHTVVMTRQKYKRHLKGRALTRPMHMFARVTYRHVDRDVPHCLKYLLTYGFYRFGVECCLLMMVLLIGLRMDIVALMYASWLCILISSSRIFLSRIWGCFTFFIAITVPLQYCVVVGLPPSLCFEFIWARSEVIQKMQEWMYLPDPYNPPSAYKIICDFVVLILVCRQAVVFRIEKRYVHHEYTGGTNKSIINEVEKSDFVNPVPDFVTYKKSLLDVIKDKFMIMFYWATLIAFFLAGMNRVNVFSLGYLIGSFIFFWQGNDLYLRPIRVILRWWKYLILYNVSVIFLKAALQVAGCIFIKHLIDHKACWFVELFGIGCIRKFHSIFHDDTGECVVPESNAGLAWDGCCFAFLIMQRRLFNSYYFQHIVNETKAMAILASRGAELIQELSAKQIREQQEAERNILEKIKYKMDRIKASQQRVQGQGPDYKEPPNHHVAIRSGDYYMFEDMDEELDLIEEKKSESSEELVTTVPSVSQDTPQERAEPRPGPSTEGLGTEAMAPDEETRKKEEAEKKEKEDEKKKDESVSGSDDSDKSAKPSFILFMKFLWTLLVSCLVSITKMLNRFSRDYRFIMRILTVEKKLLKSKRGFGHGVRGGSSMMWHPMPYILSSKPKLTAEMLEVELEGEKAEKSIAEGWLPVQFVVALSYALISHSELVCYFVIFLLQIKSATLLSLPLPLMVFLWGTLTVPRPTKNFWISIIAYTQVVIIIKCLFQFELLSWDEQAPDNRPFFLPRIIGIEKKPRYAIYDLMLLLIVFFHRSMLKSLGLWKTSEEDESTKKLTQQELEQMEREQDAESYETAGRDADSHGGDTNFFRRLKNLFQRNNVESRPTLTSEMSESSQFHGHSITASAVVHKNTVSVRYPVDAPFEYFPQIIPLTAKRYFHPAKGFFKSLLEPSIRVTADVYAYMFYCDFFNMFVIIFGFASFGSSQGDGGVTKYIEENRVPVAFLVMVILQFLLIMIDRTLYLRKFILGKILFQFALVVVIHVWMFFILPAVTERQFNAAIPPQIWYMVKCFYLLLSAYQIRSGYPTRILGNFLCKSYNYVNLYMFKAFMLVPFVFELRALMDWIWTDTSMTLSDWLKMEDIFAHIFQLKCYRRSETEYPQARGEKKALSAKYILGGAFLATIIAVIWFPLVWFALGNTVGEANLPYEVSVSVRIDAYQPIITMSARNNSIHKLTESDWERLNTVYKRSRRVQTFLSPYSHQDVGVVAFSTHSTAIWTISPPDLASLIKEAQSHNAMTIKMDWSVLRISSNPEEPPQMNSGTEISLPPYDPNRPKLVELLLDTNPKSTLFLKQIFPKFIKVTNRGTLSVIQEFMAVDDDTAEGSKYRNVILELHRKRSEADNSTIMMWWVLREDCTDSLYKDILGKLPQLQECQNTLNMYTFNDKAFPQTFNFISGKGIIGMYTTFVIVVHSFIRGFFTGISFRIMFDDMPNVDRVLQLCLDIYLVRESGELDLEEDLFAKLVFLYRSPETLIKWTRPPDEAPPDDDEDGPALLDH